MKILNYRVAEATADATKESTLLVKRIAAEGKQATAQGMLELSTVIEISCFKQW